MDVSRRKLATFVVMLTALPNVGTAFAQNGEVVDIIVRENLSYVGNTGRVDVAGLVITQGDLKIEADKGSASRLDTERSEWRLEGNVRISVRSVRIAGDEAEFSLRDNRLEHFELRGGPATFEDLEPHRAGQARGAAERVTYDVNDEVIGLRGEAEGAVGQNIVVGCDLLYDIGEKTFRSGSSECDRPFQIRIVPSDDAGTEEP